MLIHAIIAGHVGAIALVASVLAGAPEPAAAFIAVGAGLCGYAVSLAAMVRA